MRILIDLGHPAHVHYFKRFAKIMISKGHKVLFTCRDKEIVIDLLRHEELDYVSLGKNKKTLPGKFWGLFYFTFRLFGTAITFKPDIYINATIYSAIVAWVFRKPHISLEDTFNKEQVILYKPFTSCILTGDYEHPRLGIKEINYSGYQELLYLHPNSFTPDPIVIRELGINDKTPYVILRFVSWKASHDFGHKGISFENKIKAVQLFSKYARVFISSESFLPEELRPYCFPLHPSQMHNAIAFASLIWGESFTMLSEAAALGTPAILIHDTYSFYLNDQEKRYSLVFNFTESIEDQQRAIEKGIELLKTSNIKELSKKNRDKMLSDKIDVTSFFVWFIENYPDSVRIMKENPDYQYRFR
jgi:uncharacterized protein